MSRSVRTLLAIPLFACMAACQTGRTYVLESMPPAERVRTVTLRESDSTADLDPDLRQRFALKLADRIATDEQLNPPPLDVAADGQLTIEYRFILNDPGSKTTRVTAAVVSATGVPVGALGEGAVAVEATFIDEDGQRIAHIIADGPIDGPVANTGTGLDTAARSIATFARDLARGEDRAIRVANRGG